MTKMVQLSTAAYERLKNAKRSKESFSDVVLRLTATGTIKDPLAGLAGLMTWEEGERALGNIRKNRDLDRRNAWDLP